MNLICDVVSFSFVNLFNDLKTLQMLYDNFKINDAKIFCSS